MSITLPALTPRPFKQSQSAKSPLAASALRVVISGFIAEYELRHVFKNDLNAPLEAVFSFPVPLDAAFLGMRATIAGETLEATVQLARQAERAYDEAIDQGHSAVLLQVLEPGLLSVNLGNLKPGEEGSIVLRFATALACGDREARFVLPLVHRPRYGRYRLAEWAMPEVSFAIEHPLSAEIVVSGELANCPITCTHPGARFERRPDAVQITLAAAMLDRDLMLRLDLSDLPVVQASFVEDGEQRIALLAICPPMTPRTAMVDPIDLCLLLDGSGSMQGDAVMQSRAALAAIIQALVEEDRIHVIRFGSSLVPLFRRPMAATEKVRRALAELQSTIDANLGGTEMAQALDAAVAALTRTDRKAARRVIILVTDGAVQPSEVLAAGERAEAAGVRIFVVAVGSSAGVDALQPLADRTGGVLERAVPAEPIDAGVMRHFRRARAGTPLRIQVHVPDTAMVLPLAPIYRGDARLLPVFLPSTAIGPIRIDVPNEPEPWLIEPQRARHLPACRAWAGMQKLAHTEDFFEREHIALHYRLLSAETSAVLVKRRAESDRVDELPVTVPVPHMLSDGMLAGGAPGLVMSATPPAPAAAAPMTRSATRGGSLREDLVFSRRPGEDALPTELSPPEPLSDADNALAERLLRDGLIRLLLNDGVKRQFYRLLKATWSKAEQKVVSDYLRNRLAEFEDLADAMDLLDELLQAPGAPELTDDQEVAWALLRSQIPID